MNATESNKSQNNPWEALTNPNVYQHWFEYWFGEEIEISSGHNRSILEQLVIMGKHLPITSREVITIKGVDGRQYRIQSELYTLGHLTIFAHFLDDMIDNILAAEVSVSFSTKLFDRMLQELKAEEPIDKVVVMASEEILHFIRDRAFEIRLSTGRLDKVRISSSQINFILSLISEENLLNFRYELVRLMLSGLVNNYFISHPNFHNNAQETNKAFIEKQLTLADLYKRLSYFQRDRQPELSEVIKRVSTSEQSVPVEVLISTASGLQNFFACALKTPTSPIHHDINLTLDGILGAMVFLSNRQDEAFYYHYSIDESSAQEPTIKDYDEFITANVNDFISMSNRENLAWGDKDLLLKKFNMLRDAHKLFSNQSKVPELKLERLISNISPDSDLDDTLLQVQLASQVRDIKIEHSYFNFPYRALDGSDLKRRPLSSIKAWIDLFNREFAKLDHAQKKFRST